MRRENLRFGGHQAVERLLAPADESLGRFLLLDLALLLGVARRLRHRARVLDVMFGRFGDHQALRVESGAARAARDLMELARPQTALLAAVVFRQRGEQDRVDRNVDAHAERVGAADHRQKALLRQALDQEAVARQHARVVHAHAAAQEALERLAEPGGEARAFHCLLHGLALLLGRDAVARQRLGGCQRRVLREMHHVQRSLPLAQGELDGGLERREHVFVRQRHRTRRVEHRVDGAPGALTQRRRYGRHVAKRGAHQQKLRLLEDEQRHLPRPAAVGLAVVVELVDGDAADIGILPLAQRPVCQDLLRAADHRGVGVDAGVAGDHAHVVAAEHLHQVEELLADQRLDGCGVV